jgi:hypothetical protein
MLPFAFFARQQVAVARVFVDTLSAAPGKQRRRPGE